MSVLDEALATPHEFHHKGKVYKVRLMDLAFKSSFQRRLFAKAREAAALMRDLYTQEDYQAELRHLNDAYISGEYAFESERGLAAMKTVPGMVMICSLLFGVDEMEIIKLMSERQEDITFLIQLVIKESFPEAEEGEGSPNRERLGEGLTQPNSVPVSQR